MRKVIVKSEIKKLKEEFKAQGFKDFEFGFDEDIERYWSKYIKGEKFEAELGFDGNCVFISKIIKEIK